jgi:hypothetical protein
MESLAGAFDNFDATKGWEYFFICVIYMFLLMESITGAFNADFNATDIHE